MGTRRRRASEVDMFEVDVRGEKLLVVSLPTARLDDAGLSAAERAVARDAARGLSNQEIARRRGRSQRTIANQLASVFRKLGVSSRAELTARFARSHGK